MDLDWKDSAGNSQLFHPLSASRGTSTHSPRHPATRSAARDANSRAVPGASSERAGRPGHRWPQGNGQDPVGHGSQRPAWPVGCRQPLQSNGAAVGCVEGVRWGVLVGGLFFFFLVRLLGLAAVSPPPHVTSRDAGETRSHSSRDRRLCHCSTAVRCALSIRRQWLDSGAPVEYCPITILPMKSLLLFTLCPYTGESRNRDRSRQKHPLSTRSTAPGKPNVPPMPAQAAHQTPAVLVYNSAPQKC